MDDPKTSAKRSRRTISPIGGLLAPSCIAVDAHAGSVADAVRLVGTMLVAADAVDSSYVQAMLEREESISTFVGEGIAFPHATSAAQGSVHRDAIALARFPAGVDWNGQTVHVAIGIAAIGRGHIGILSQLASALLVPHAAARLRSATTPEEVLELLRSTA